MAVTVGLSKEDRQNSGVIYNDGWDLHPRLTDAGKNIESKTAETMTRIKKDPSASVFSAGNTVISHAPQKNYLSSLESTEVEKLKK